jgi:hypothetical protein
MELVNRAIRIGIITAFLIVNVSGIFARVSSIVANSDIIVEECTDAVFHSTLSTNDDNELVMVVVNENYKKIIRISFNGNEGSNGTLRIYNASRDLVKKANFELIKSPFYASVDVTNLVAGTYTAELTTEKAVHSYSLIIK